MQLEATSEHTHGFSEKNKESILETARCINRQEELKKVIYCTRTKLMNNEYIEVFKELKIFLKI